MSGDGSALNEDSRTNAGAISATEVVFRYLTVKLF
jgi:hypothetical protein